MSVGQGGDETIILSGNCPVDDAEPLLQLLQKNPAARVDWTGCRQLHTAALQVILACRPTLTGPCGDPWLQNHLIDLG